MHANSHRTLQGGPSGCSCHTTAGLSRQNMLQKNGDCLAKKWSLPSSVHPCCQRLPGTGMDVVMVVEDAKVTVVEDVNDVGACGRRGVCDLLLDCC